MPPAGYLQCAQIVHFRTAPVAGRRQFRERSGQVDLGKPACDRTDRRRRFGDASAHVFENSFFDLVRASAGAEYAGFQFRQPIRGESDGVRSRLPVNERLGERLGEELRRVACRNFHEIPQDIVELHLQGLNARLPDVFSLQFRNDAAGLIAQAAALVQLGVETVADVVPVANRQRRIFLDRSLETLFQTVQFGRMVIVGFQCAGQVFRHLPFTYRISQHESLADGCGVPRPSAFQAQSGKCALDVGQPAKQVADRIPGFGR